VSTVEAKVSAKLRARSIEDEQRLERWERKAQLPIVASALLPIVFSLAGTQSIIADTVMIVAWIVFIADLVVHVRLVPRFLRTRWGVFDFVVVILTAPWFLIPGLGTARFLMLARLARLVRVVKAGGKKLTQLFEQLGRLGIVVSIIIVTCAYVAYHVERATNPLFNSFGTSVWWAVVTITTVGYGDVYPITTAGRITGVVLMFSGLALFGVLAGTLATFFGFGEREDAANAATPARDNASDDELEERLAELEQAIAAIRGALHSRARSGEPAPASE
jgi:voltage-gated potassium channel